MHSTRRIRVFKELDFLSCLLSAYSRKNFRCHNWSFILRSVIYALGSTTMIIFLLIDVLLMIWHLIAVNADFEKFCDSLPLVFSVLQMEIIFIALMLKHRVITKTVNRLQAITNQRKC